MRTLFHKRKHFFWSVPIQLKFLDKHIFILYKNFFSFQHFSFFLMQAQIFSYRASLKRKMPYLRKRHCILTGRGRSVYVRFGNISRFTFKDLAAFGYIPGIQQTW